MHHLTHISNLKEILKNGLKSRNKLDGFFDTADQDMIDERKSVNGIDLNDYVPFHIDFLHSSHTIGYNYVVLRNNGKENMVFLISNPPENGLFFLYHPASTYSSEFTEFSKFQEKLQEKYSLLKNNNKLDYTSHEVQQFLMSEILIFDKVDIGQIKEIYVYSESIKLIVDNLLKALNIRHIQVIIKKTFFGR